MKAKTNIVEVTPDNIAEYPQAICFINPKHPLFNKKVEWYKDQFEHGLTIKLLYWQDSKKPVGFIEYVPGKYCWRSVSAKDYMFIHCLWINGKKYQHHGLGQILLEEAEQDAKKMNGVAAITSDKSFMSTKDIFIKNGYTLVSESEKNQLVVKQFRNGSLPSINNWEGELKKHKGLTMLYSRQCPWVARFIEEVKPFLKKENLEPKVIELKIAAEAQKAPSLYSVFNLIYNGRLLADRYISTTRFLNIVKTEIKSLH